MTCTVAVYSVLYRNKGAPPRGVGCKAQLPAPESPLSSGHNAPPELHRGKLKPPQKLLIQPQSVQLQQSRSSSEQGNITYQAARQRLTFALLEEDVEAAIDAVSECAFESFVRVLAGS